MYVDELTRYPNFEGVYAFEDLKVEGVPEGTFEADAWAVAQSTGYNDCQQHLLTNTLANWLVGRYRQEGIETLWHSADRVERLYSRALVRQITQQGPEYSVVHVDPFASALLIALERTEPEQASDLAAYVRLGRRMALRERPGYASPLDRVGFEKS